MPTTSQLPSLRLEQRANFTTPEAVSSFSSARGASHVSSSTVTAAQRALNGEPAPRSSRSRERLHSHTSPLGFSGMYNAYPSDPNGASHSLSSSRVGGASDNNYNSIIGKNASTALVGRPRLPYGTTPPPPQQQAGYDTALPPPSLVGAAMGLSMRHDTAPPAQSSYLEHISQGVTLSPQSYLPQLRPTASGSAPSPPLDGVVALQDATTGLLVRHLAAENRDGQEGVSLFANEAAVDGESAKAINTAYETTRAAALKNAVPFVSAAVQDAGVDDRINPFVLDKMLRQGRRQAATVAAAKARMDGSKKNFLSSSPGAAAAAAAAESKIKKAADGVSAGARSSAEARYHEPPALQAAYQAVAGPDQHVAARQAGAEPGEERAAANTTSNLKGTGFAEILAEFAIDPLQTGEGGRTLASRPTHDQQVPGKRGAAPLMSSEDYTRLASAASANDAAFIRQLVNYYTARSRHTAAASQKVRFTAASISHAGHGGDSTARALARTEGQEKNERDVFDATSDIANAVEGSGGFSLLDAVLSVSREYVEVQASEMGVPGKGTAAPSERRRRLQRQLVTLDHTRIPESHWVTCAPPLSRLNALTSAKTTASRSSAGPPGAARASDPAAGAVDGGLSRGALLMASQSGVKAPGESLFSLRDQASLSVDAASNVATQHEGSVHPSQRQRGGTAGAVANSIFPAARPMDRSQVYMLADVLDRMLRDPAHPQWVELLSNPEVARYVFAEKDEEHATEKPSGQLSREDEFAGDDAYAEMWGQPGEQRLMAYTGAALQVLDILDTGLTELVRQVTCHCTERGALLDLLRQSVVDIAAAQVHLLSQVKRSARQDAATAVAVQGENAQLRERLAATQRELAELKTAHEQLQIDIEPIQRKSDRLDELMARVASKARRFETHRHDEHIALLQLLEESMKLATTTAADKFYNEVNDMHARHAGEERGDDGSSSSSGPGGRGKQGLVALANEMPSVTAARTHAAEQRLTMERMYGESHQLLRALQDTVEATNAVCAPLYNKMVLSDVSPVAKVATSRWTTIARAVGAFEKEKRHRQRVYEVFTEYCTVHRHQLAARDAGAGRGGQGPLGDWDASAGDAAPIAKSYGESFLTGNESGGSAESGKGGAKEDTDVGEEETLQQRRITKIAVAASSASPSTVTPFGSIITRADLEAMSATDCGVEEVNALFHKDFDIRAYLRGSWEDFVHARQLQEAASGVNDVYTLRLPDLLQMLGDMHATLAEVTLRMRAMADSGVLQAFFRPPLEPPAHPEVPCPLCSRRDSSEVDRQRRREAMSRIARDLQGKMDAVEAKSRAAQLERDEAKREVRRLQMELQQVSKGNMPTSTTSHPSKSNTSMHLTRNSSISFRRGRRDTSIPLNSSLQHEPYSANTSMRSQKSASQPTTYRHNRRSTSAEPNNRRDATEEENEMNRATNNLAESPMLRTATLGPGTTAGTASSDFLRNGDDDDYPDGESDTSIPSMRRGTAAM